MTSDPVYTCCQCGAPRLSARGACPSCNAVCRAHSGPGRAALILGLVTAGCGEDGPFPIAQPEYGVADTAYLADNDGDGFSEADGDCDDDDETVNPEAEETPGDGVDSNCRDGDDE